MKHLIQLHVRAWSLLFCALMHQASAQQLFYTSYYVTTCVDADNPSQPGLVTGGPEISLGEGNQTPGHVSYTMPECVSCGCDSCTTTSTFTTTFPAFCPGAKSRLPSGKPGVIEQTYTVTETYVGVSQLPRFAAPTLVPFGFTVSVATCTGCTHAAGGEQYGQAVVETMTYPQDRTPFAPGKECEENCEGNDGTGTGTGTTSAPLYVSGSATPPVVVTVSAAQPRGGPSRWLSMMLAAVAAVAASL